MTHRDLFDQTISVGDSVAYPAPEGAHGARIDVAEIVAFVDLVPHSNGKPGNFMRVDHSGKQSPTVFAEHDSIIQISREESRWQGARGGYTQHVRKATLTPNQRKYAIKVSA